MLQKKQFLLGLIIIGALGGYYFYSMYQEVKKETIAQLNAQQMIYAKQAAKGIENYFKDIYRVLKVFSETKNIIYLDDSGKNTLKTYYELDKYNIKGISRIDNNGRVIYTYPETQFIGLDISNQASFQQIKATLQPSISDVFISNRGYQVISYHMPIFKEGVWDGSIAVFINYEMISKEFFENIKIGKSGYARVISQNGIILYTPNTKNLGKNIIEATSKFPSTVAIAKLMMEGKEGTTSYEWDMVGEEYTGRIVKQAVFCPIKLGSTFWSIIVSTPENEIFAVMQGFIRKSLVIISIFICIIILLIYVQIKYWSQQREEQLKKSSEKALRESEERYHTIFNQAPLGIMQFNNQGVVVEVNEKFKEIMGYPREKIIAFNLLHQLKDEAMLEAVKIALQGQKGYYEGDYFSESANKLTSLRAVYNSLKDDNGNLVGGIAIFEDISERKQTQEMIEEQLFFFQTLIDSMPFPIFYKDAVGKYLGCNLAFENFTGIPRNEMIGKNVFEVYPPNLAATYYDSDSEMVKAEVKHNYESYFLRADGSQREVFIQKAPFLNADGSLGGIIGSIIDITDRKQMEERLEILVNIRTAKLTKAIEQLQREMQERKNTEEKLLASEAKYRNIFENTFAGIAQTTLDGKFITVNPAGAALLGYASPDDLINSTYDIGKQFVTVQPMT